MNYLMDFPLLRLKDTLSWAFDPAVGIISKISEHPVEPDSPSLFRFVATAANTSAFCKQKNFRIGSGASLSKEMAMTKAVGEAIERYCAAIYDHKELPLFSYNNAPFFCIDPDKFALYSKAQYNHDKFYFEPFTKDSVIRWTQAVNLSNKELIWVPASMVYVPYSFYKKDKEVPIIQPISTGLSLHCSYIEAILGGICEVIERDCFTITWQAKMSRTRIRNNSLSEINKGLVDKFEKVGYQIHLIDISNETNIPTVLSVATNDRTRFVPIVVAAATSLSPEVAVRKSLEELAHTERYAYQIRNEAARLKEKDKVFAQMHHINFWLNPEFSKYASFLYMADERKDFCDLSDFSKSSPVEEVQLLVSLMNKTGYDVLVADITTEDVKMLGMSVVRVIIPGYHPLFMGYNNRALGGHRLWTIPENLGHKGITLEKGDFPFPHPFP